MLILLWLALSIIPAAIASSKGRNGVTWFFLSVCFSPLIIGIVAACLRTDRKTLERKALAEDMRKCPYCAELVKREATLCRYCRSELPAILPQPQAPGLPVNVTEIVNCPRCNQRQYPKPEGMCNACGAPLTA